MDLEGEIFDDFGTIEEGHEVAMEDNDEEGGDNQEEAEEVEERAKKVVKPKKVVKHPRVRLNVEALLGQRGLPVVTNVLKKVKLKGKGYEREDLNRILSGYKYWCHRMSPKTPFDQAVEIIEKLGTKRPVITYLKKIRSGMIEEPQTDDIVEDNDEDEIKETVSPKKSAFDELLPLKPPISKPVELTLEQKELIQLNKQRAMKIREERLKRLQQQKENLDTQDSTKEYNSQLNQYDDSQEMNSQLSQVDSQEMNSQLNQPKGSQETNSQLNKIDDSQEINSQLNQPEDSQDLFSQSIDRENSQMKRINLRESENACSQLTNQDNSEDSEMFEMSQKGKNLESPVNGDEVQAAVHSPTLNRKEGEGRESELEKMDESDLEMGKNAECEFGSNEESVVESNSAVVPTKENFEINKDSEDLFSQIINENKSDTINEKHTEMIIEETQEED